MSSDTDVTRGAAEATPHPTDQERFANAQAASHGFGAGRFRASRLIDGWDDERTRQQAVLVLENLDVAQAYAERESVPFDDYVNGLRADPELDRTLTPERLALLEKVFITGYDIGFRASLVERLAEVRQHMQMGAENE